MARVRLAHWHKGGRPGSVVEVSDEEVHGLLHDGRVAEVVGDQGESAPATAVSAPSKSPADSRSSREQHEKLAEVAKPRRRVRSDEE